MNSPAKVTYILSFFSDKDEKIKLSEDQYLILRGALNRDKFLEINGSTYNASDIKRMERTVEKVKPMGTIGNFSYYTNQELEEYLAHK